MKIISNITRLLALLPVLVLAACGAKLGGGPPPAGPEDYVELTRAIHDLGPGIDMDEGERLARIALDYTHQLALQYQITDPPLIHNTKVNMGLKPRGLCKDWADDLEARLRQEGFVSVAFHRAIANSDEAFRIEHSTVIISQPGDSMFEGLVLDPWRYGGILHWVRTLEDEEYRWIPRAEVFAAKLRSRTREERFSTSN